MRDKQSKGSLWSGLLVIILLVAISLVASKSFEAHAPGLLDDTGKNGLYLFKRILAAQGIHLESYQMTEDMSDALEAYGATTTGQRILVHLVPYQSDRYSPQQQQAIAERISQLQDLDPSHLVFRLDFDTLGNAEIYEEAFYDNQTLNGYILQNKSIPFEMALVDGLIDTLLEQVNAKSPSHVRWIYHGDVLKTQTSMRHWLLAMPPWFQWGLVQGLLLAGIYFLAFGRSFGFPLKDKGEDEPTPLTFVRASAAYFKRHRLHALTLELYYQRLERFREHALQQPLDPALAQRLKNIDTIRQRGWRTDKGHGLKGKLLYRALRDMDQLTSILKEKRTQRWKPM